MTSLDARDRDEFLKALEEARRAAMGDADETGEHASDTPPVPPSSPEFRNAVERLATRLRSYISARFLARLYTDTATEAPPPQPEPDPKPEPEPEPQPAAAPPPPPLKSDLERVIDELHLTPDLTVQDLARIRREFAKGNHPDRVVAPQREEATRRMTIANVLIDEALRGRKSRAY
jgi:hypothetical protein